MAYSILVFRHLTAVSITVTNHPVIVEAPLSHITYAKIREYCGDFVWFRSMTIWCTFLPPHYIVAKNLENRLRAGDFDQWLTILQRRETTKLNMY